MEIKIFKDEDLQPLLTLFNETIQFINSNDYDYEQIEVMLEKSKTEADWIQKFSITSTYVAKIDGILIGFANVTETGNIEYLYTHRDHQGKGIATALLQHIITISKEKNMPKIFVESTITAKTFFEKHGFKTITPQQKRFGDIVVLNYFMRKNL